MSEADEMELRNLYDALAASETKRVAAELELSDLRGASRKMANALDVICNLTLAVSPKGDSLPKSLCGMTLVNGEANIIRELVAESRRRRT